MSWFRFREKSGVPEKDVIIFYIECGQCQEKIEVRVNKRYELEDEYLSSSPESPRYTLKKEILGKNCSNLMRLEVGFDKEYRIFFQELDGGKIIQDDENRSSC